MLQRIIASGSADERTEGRARRLFDELQLTAQEKLAFAEFGAAERAQQGQSRSSAASAMSPGSQRKKGEHDNSERTVRGELTKVECTDGLTLHVKIGADERVENVRTQTPDVIDWVTDAGTIAAPIECGVLTSPARIALTYRPKRKGLTMGEPVVVEFLTFRD